MDNGLGLMPAIQNDGGPLTAVTSERSLLAPSRNSYAGPGNRILQRALYKHQCFRPEWSYSFASEAQQGVVHRGQATGPA
jgi:hypothetical protein